MILTLVLGALLIALAWWASLRARPLQPRRLERERRVLGALLAALCACIAVPALAQADGDPGSDVLLAQNLFFGSDAGISVKQELSLDQLLTATAKAGAPVRVAIIAHKDDLGTVGPLWQKPQTYAVYLGTELSNTYSGRLLVVMPNGYGIYWHANPAGASKLASRLSNRRPTSTTGAGLAAATAGAVDRIEASAGVDASKFAPSLNQTGTAPSKGGANFDASTPANASGAASTPEQSKHKLPSGWLLVVHRGAAARLCGFADRTPPQAGVAGQEGSWWPKGVRVSPIALLPTALLVIVAGALVINQSGSSGIDQGRRRRWRRIRISIRGRR